MEVSFFTSFYFAESVGGIHGENGVSQNELGEDVLVKDLYLNVYILETLPKAQRTPGLSSYHKFKYKS